MKKFSKFVLGTVSVATLAAGAYYLYKTYIKDDNSDDFDDFEDDFEDFDTDEEEASVSEEAREYVSLNLSQEEAAEDASVEEDTESEI